KVAITPVGNKGTIRRLRLVLASKLQNMLAPGPCQRVGKAPVAVVIRDATGLNGDIRITGNPHDRKSHRAQVLRVDALNTQFLDRLVAMYWRKTIDRIAVF